MGRLIIVAAAAVAGCAAGAPDDAREVSAPRTSVIGALPFGDATALEGVAASVVIGSEEESEALFADGVRAVFGRDAEGRHNSFESGGDGAVVRIDESNGDPASDGAVLAERPIAFGDRDGFTAYGGTAVGDGEVANGVPVGEVAVVTLITDAPVTAPYEHLAYGVWLDGRTVEGRNRAAFSAGALGLRTPVSAVPLAGTALYEGDAYGLFTGETGGDFLADVTAEVDFGAGRVTLETSDTVSRSGETFAPDPGRDLTASGALVGGRMVGPARTAGGLEGQAIAELFGPDASELGGGFAVSGGGEIMLGGFGAKRVGGAPDAERAPLE